MAFKLGKGLQDIEEPEQIPGGTYNVVIKRASMEPNKAGDSTNLVVRMTVIKDPDYRDRGLTKWLALPKNGDEDRILESGHSLADFKLLQIRRFAEAFDIDCDEELPETEEEARTMGWTGSEGEVEVTYQAGSELPNVNIPR